MKLSKRIAAWLKSEVKKAGKKGIIVGLSGGIDSACVAALAKMALGKNVLGLILPCRSHPDDMKYALQVARRFRIKTKKAVLDRMFDAFVKINPRGSALARANLKPRLRMISLYYFANDLDYLVAGTGNKSELTIGYFTKHGDGGVDILPLGGLLKREVRALARELGVPDEVIERPPSAGLWHGQTDEGEIGVTYDELDAIISAIEHRRTRGMDMRRLSKVRRMMAHSEHKRCGLPVFKK
jgi:NAD+ synthase